ncbi:uncharacterized protein LOC117782813 isoform X1 [Drosophila innubila]|uniref:uncharacterized protein LOC117782813 isoform X1 n=1 Tax=Drosophila innubila TaxID=198719 RepID=UPI00148C81C2|nr:uncharacterized protein LOC117782813 isoform X1 [Drosophila innubila]
MAPTVASVNVTTSTVASIQLSSVYINSTTSTTLAYNDYGGSNNATIYWPDPEPDYVYFYSGYAFYIVIFVCFVVILPCAVIMNAMQRKRQENARRLVEQRQRARREMEISIANNNPNIGNSGGGNGSVSIQTENDMTILPKGMDLPPSYDELNYTNNVKPPGSLGASMLTITTDLDCSNTNLAAALNEPPPDYIEPTASATTTTTTTTTVVVSGPLPRI